MAFPSSPSSSGQSGLGRMHGQPDAHEQGRTLCVRFNQTGGCFACGTEAGIRVYNCDPFKETIRRNFGVSQKRLGASQGPGGSRAVCEFGGVGSIEMLFRSNLFAIVGGGDFPCFSPEKVLIWDDHQCKWIGELGFHSKVLGIRLRRDKIVVALKNKIFIYNFEDLKQLQQLESVDNPKGLCALSSQQDRTVLVCPGLQPGQIRVEHLDHRRSNFINNAHASDLACLALSLDGTLLASASEKGTLIRIWRTTPNQDGSSSSSSSSSFGIIVPRTSGGAGTNSSFLEQELRRGSDRAEIYSIAFSPSKSWLAATSNKGTVHIWPLQSNEDASASAYGNEVSSPSRVIPTWASRLTNNFVPSYFHSKWSLAQYRLGDDSRSEVTFGTKENTLIVITCSGKFHKVQFDIQGGECKKISFCKFA